MPDKAKCILWRDGVMQDTYGRPCSKPDLFDYGSAEELAMAQAATRPQTVELAAPDPLEEAVIHGNSVLLIHLWIILAAQLALVGLLVLLIGLVWRRR